MCLCEPPWGHVHCPWFQFAVRRIGIVGFIKSPIGVAFRYLEVIGQQRNGFPYCGLMSNMSYKWSGDKLTHRGIHGQNVWKIPKHNVATPVNNGTWFNLNPSLWINWGETNSQTLLGVIIISIVFRRDRVSVMMNIPLGCRR